MAERVDPRPGEILLRRIHVERERFMGGKSQRQQPPPPIDFDEIPFPLPEQWQWIRLNDLLAGSFYGPRFGAEEYCATGIPTIRTTDMTPEGRIVLRDPPRVSVPPDRLKDFMCEENDLLITRTGSIGTMAIFNGTYPAIPSAYLIRLRFTQSVCVRYLHMSLRSPYGQAALGLSTTKVAQPNINARNLSAIPIPVPPLNEQYRIVAKVDELMALCDRLEAQLAISATESQRLLEAVLHEVLGEERLEGADRRDLKEAYREASRATRRSTTKEIRDLDHLADEGLD